MYIHIYLYTNIPMYIYTYVHIYIYTYVHIYIYTYIQIYRGFTPHRSLDAQKYLHKAVFTQRHLFTQTLLHTKACAIEVGSTWGGRHLRREAPEVGGTWGGRQLVATEVIEVGSTWTKGSKPSFLRPLSKFSAEFWHVTTYKQMAHGLFL